MQQNWVTAPQASCFFEIKHQDRQHRVTRVIQLREDRTRTRIVGISYSVSCKGHIKES